MAAPRFFKKQFITFLFILMSFILLAQKDSVPVSKNQFVFASGLILFAPGFKFEFPKNDYSYGFNIQGLFFANVGVKVEPFKGLYIQGKLSAGAYYYWLAGALSEGQINPINLRYGTLGLGCAVGYQWIIEKRHNLALDLFGEIQGSITIPYNADNMFSTYLTSGIPVELGFRIGKAFY